MYAKLCDLWFVDHSARARLYIVSSVVGFGYGVVNSLLLGRPEGRVTWETLGLLCATVLGFSIFYCTREKPTGLQRKGVLSASTWLVMVAAGATTIILLFALAIPKPPLYMTERDFELDAIRKVVQRAEKQRTVLPHSQISTYNRAMLKMAPSSGNYWTTAAAVINYQSLVNQITGEAPDPSQVARPCFPVLLDSKFTGGRVTDCVVDLDTNAFEGTTFENSVVRYHGGPVSLRNVRFVNCRFVLAIAPGTTAPASPELLEAILRSENQKTIKVTD